MNPTSFVVPGLLASILMSGCATRTVYVIDDRDDVVASAPVRRVQRPAPQPAPQAPQQAPVVAQADPDAAYAQGYSDGYADAPNYEADAGITNAGDFYGPLATYGTWVSYPGYGNVWRPSVAVVGRNFRPYTHGHWEYSEWGWTWVDHHAFGWATGHYGRWFYDNNQGWLWVPGTTWAPAWVTWRTGGSYIGWAAMPPGSIYGGGYSVYDTSWVFVSNGNFGATYIGGVIVTGSGYRSCYASTYPQRGTTVVYGRPVYRGPDYTEVSRNTRVIHRPIREAERDNAVTRPPRGTVVGRDRDDDNRGGNDGRGGNGGNGGRGSNGTGRDRDNDGTVVGRDRDDDNRGGRGSNDGRGNGGSDGRGGNDGRGSSGRDDDRGTGRIPVVSDPRGPRDLRDDDIRVTPRDVVVPDRNGSPTSPTNPVRGGSRDDVTSRPDRGDDVMPTRPTRPTNPKGPRDDDDDDNDSSSTPTPVIPRDGSMGGYRGVRETPPTRTYLDEPTVLRESTRAPGVPTRGSVPGRDPMLDRGQPSRDSMMDRGQPSRDSTLDRGQPSRDSMIDRGQPSRDSTIDRGQPSRDSMLDRGQPSSGFDRNRTVTPSRPSRERRETIAPSQPRQPSASPAPSSPRQPSASPAPQQPRQPSASPAPASSSSSSSSSKRSPPKSSGSSSGRKSSPRPR